MEASAERVEGTDLGRVLAFTDGVLAIAITLLVLNLEIPDVADGELRHKLVDLLPQLGAYFLSFAVVGRFWLVHHRVFATMRSFDANLIALNLLYLALVVLVPFTTELLGEYGDHSLAVSIYAAVMGLAATVNWLMVRYIMKRGHVRESEREQTKRYAERRWLETPAIFFLSIPVSVFSPLLAELMWISLLVVLRRLRR